MISNQLSKMVSTAAFAHFLSGPPDSQSPQHSAALTDTKVPAIISTPSTQISIAPLLPVQPSQKEMMKSLVDIDKFRRPKCEPGNRVQAIRQLEYDVRYRSTVQAIRMQLKDMYDLKSMTPSMFIDCVVQSMLAVSQVE